jgi:hypothetical protein
MTYKQQKAQERRLLDMASHDVWRESRKDLRELFRSFNKQGYSVQGYRGRLERALEIVTRAEGAIKSLGYDPQPQKSVRRSSHAPSRSYGLALDGLRLPSDWLGAALNLILDFETRSNPRHQTSRTRELHRKAAEPLCVAWAIDSGPVELLEFAVDAVIRGHGFLQVKSLIRNSQITKIAQNISFERALLRKLGCDTPISEWVDTSVLARHAGLPSKLADICKALKLGDLGKNEDGSRLIRKFCVPKKDGTYRDKTTDPVDWQKFLDYCRQDVVAEREVFNRLRSFHLPPREKKLWELDDKINRRGWPVDMDYVKNAHSYAKLEKQKLVQELKALTGLANPNSRDQFLGWARSQGYEFNSLGKAFIKRFEAMLEEDEVLVDTP